MPAPPCELISETIQTAGPPGAPGRFLLAQHSPEGSGPVGCGLERSGNQMAMPEAVAVTLNSLVQRVHLLIFNVMDAFSVTTTCQAPLHTQDTVLQKAVLVMSSWSWCSRPLGAMLGPGRKRRCAWGAGIRRWAPVGHSVWRSRAGVAFRRSSLLRCLLHSRNSGCLDRLFPNW